MITTSSKKDLCAYSLRDLFIFTFSWCIQRGISDVLNQWTRHICSKRNKEVKYRKSHLNFYVQVGSFPAFLFFLFFVAASIYSILGKSDQNHVTDMVLTYQLSLARPLSETGWPLPFCHHDHLCENQQLKFLWYLYWFGHLYKLGVTLILCWFWIPLTL